MKILIIGQAPPAVKQELPYDTTLLYDMFAWIGISKAKAVQMFEFEAMVDEFPGRTAKGHIKPSREKMFKHYRNVLLPKIDACDKILILGNVAKDALIENGIHSIKDESQLLFLIHPSKRNYSKIMESKASIIQSLRAFLNV